MHLIYVYLKQYIVPIIHYHVYCFFVIYIWILPKIDIHIIFSSKMFLLLFCYLFTSELII